MRDENELLLKHLREMHKRAIDPLRVYKDGKCIYETKLCTTIFGRERCNKIIKSLKGFLLNRFNIVISY